MKSRVCLLLFIVTRLLAAEALPPLKIGDYIELPAKGRVKVVGVSSDGLMLVGKGFLTKVPRSDLPENITARMPSPPPPPQPPVSVASIKELRIVRWEEDKHSRASMSLWLDSSMSGRLILSVNEIEDKTFDHIRHIHLRADQINEVTTIMAKFERWVDQCAAEKIPVAIKTIGKVGDENFDLEFRYFEGGSFRAALKTPAADFALAEVDLFLKLLPQFPGMVKEFEEKMEATRKVSELK